MATGGTLSSGSIGDRSESLICSMCLEVFSQPKLLPCHHTFCLKCLEDLTSRCPSRTLPCPQCRRHFTVPSEGVAAFQNNFYLHPEDLDQAREGALCLTHPRQDLDMYCVDCRLPVCPRCVLAEHRSHKTQGLSEAVEKISAQMSRDQLRLQKAVSVLIEEVESVKRELERLRDKKAAVETAIRKKHASLVKAADAFRDGALVSLNESSERLERGLIKVLGLQQNQLERVCQLQENVEQAVSSGAKHKLHLLAKEMREGRGSPEELDELVAHEKSDVLSLKLWSDFPSFHFRQFLYTVFKSETWGLHAHIGNSDSVQKGDQVSDGEQVQLKVIVEKQFTCGKDSDTEVFSLCPLDDGNILVSYTLRAFNKHAPSEKFDKTGKSLLTREKATGQVSFLSIGDGFFRQLLPVGDTTRVYCKTRTTPVHFKLFHSVEGKANITKVKVTSKFPFKAELETEFSIKVGAFRAFDVDDSEQLFVVLEEPQGADPRRKLRMYQRSTEDAIATYTPPTPAFQPSDVCFFTMGSQQVLLVANEGNDCIHVVNVQDGAIRFLRYLAPGCSLLVQPIALNTDAQGRLWVACRGGDIITIRMIPMS